MAKRQNRHETEEKIRRAFTHVAPNDPNALLSAAERSTEKKGRILTMKETRRTSPIVRRVAGLVAALILMLGLGTTIYVYQTNAVANTVSLDVNPSLEIHVNKNETVVEVTALNEDGRVVLGDMNFEGSSLDVTVNALIGSMLRNGYINEIANSILLSINGNDEEKSAALQEKLTGAIDQLLAGDLFQGSVLSQTVKEDKELRTLAETYGITLGKAQLIRQITRQNTRYTFEELVPLSINQLNLLSESGNTRLEHVEATGTASDKGYIGTEAARAAALTHAGVTESEITKYRSKLDFENGVMVYEIEFDCEGYEYEYDIHAENGTVVKCEKETSKKQDTTDVSAYIGEEAALAAVAKHADLPAEFTPERYSCRLEKENKVMVYDIEFVYEGTEYDYNINAATGEVEKYERETEERFTAPTENSTSKGQISKEEAIAAALAHAGLRETDVSKLKSELDRDDGILVYEVEFRVGQTEYEYEIHAANGAVLKYEKEIDD